MVSSSLPGVELVDPDLLLADEKHAFILRFDKGIPQEGIRLST
jgi:hypothetical protein